MQNYFQKTLCSLLSAGFILTGCTSPITYENPDISNKLKIELSEQKYKINEDESEARTRAREEILGFFGLDKLLIFPRKLKLYESEHFDAKIRLKLMSIEDILHVSSEDRNLVDTLDFGIGFRF